MAPRATPSSSSSSSPPPPPPWPGRSAQLESNLDAPLPRPVLHVYTAHPRRGTSSGPACTTNRQSAALALGPSADPRLQKAHQPTLAIKLAALDTWQMQPMQPNSTTRLLGAAANSSSLLPPTPAPLTLTCTWTPRPACPPVVKSRQPTHRQTARHHWPSNAQKPPNLPIVLEICPDSGPRTGAGGVGKLLQKSRLTLTHKTQVPPPSDQPKTPGPCELGPLSGLLRPILPPHVKGGEGKGKLLPCKNHLPA